MGTVRIHRFSETWRAGWEAFVERAPGAGLAHAWAWPTIASRALGHEDRSLVAERGGEPCGVLPMVQLRHWFFGTFHVSLPWLDYGGVLADDTESARRLLEAATAQARQERAEFIELRSMDSVYPDLPVRRTKVTFWLRLGNADALWKGFDPKVRNQVRKAQKAGLMCHFGREELLPEFYRIFARNMRDLGTPVWGIAFFKQILNAFPKTAEVAVVRMAEKAIGGGLVIAFKDTVHMPSASSLRYHFHLCPNNLLYWEVIRRACEQGYRTFDFGRSTVGSGTYLFKRQWGGEVKPLHWQYVLLTRKTLPQFNASNPKFRIAAGIWKHLPVPLATWLGPRIVRHLP